MTVLWCMAIAVLAQADGDVDGFLASVVEARRDLGVLEARFEMTNQTPADGLKRSTGDLLYVRPRRLVFRMYEPGTEEADMVFVVDNARVYEYDEELKQLLIYNRQDAADMEALFAAFEGDPRLLKEAYDVELMGSSADSPGSAAGLVLRPRDGEEEGLHYFQEVRVVFRGSDYLPVNIILQGEQDTRIAIEFDSFRLNEPVDPARTQVEVPKGTMVVEDGSKSSEVRRKSKRFPEALKPQIPEPSEAESGADSESLGGGFTVSRIVLASASPRRRALLSALGMTFDVVVSDAPERLDGAPAEVVVANARAKRDDVAGRLAEPGLVIAADTLVFLDDHPLGKPGDLDEACEMLFMLFGAGRIR